MGMYTSVSMCACKNVTNYFTYLVLGRLCVPNDLPNKVVESEVPLTGLSSTGPCNTKYSEYHNLKYREYHSL